MRRPPPRSTLFPYTTLFRSRTAEALGVERSNLYRKMRAFGIAPARRKRLRSEEHTSELQSHHDLVCRLLLEKKKKTDNEAILYWTESHQKIMHEQKDDKNSS